MRIVTSGKRYLDIDGYAAIIAYAELLQKQGHKATAVSTSIWNESIPPSLRALQAPLITHYHPTSSDTFTVVDVSDPKYLDPIVDISRVVEVIDHHLGQETKWADRHQVNLDIEFIGAACTQIFERWQQAGRLPEMTKATAQLLAAGILDNTLNFKAGVTTHRDRQAYAELARHTGIPADWPAKYFSECQQAITADVRTSMENDTKILHFETINTELGVGQLVIWDAHDILESHLDTIETVMSEVRAEWFMNLVSVEEGSSYLVAKDQRIKNWLSGLLKLKFNGDIAKAGRLWLRKEIIKADLTNIAKSN